MPPVVEPPSKQIRTNTDRSNKLWLYGLIAAVLVIIMMLLFMVGLVGFYVVSHLNHKSTPAPLPAVSEKQQSQASSYSNDSSRLDPQSFEVTYEPKDAKAIRQAFVEHFSTQTPDLTEIDARNTQEYNRFLHDVKLMLYNRQYRELDQLVETIRNQKESARTYSGYWKLDLFYQAMSQEEPRYEAFQPGSFFATLDAWQKAYPSSPMPSLIKINSNYIRAFQARGTANADKLSLKQKGGFQIYIARAQAEMAMLESRFPKLKTPDYFNLKLYVAHAQAMPKADYLALAQQATDAFPYYAPNYAVVVWYLLPKWYGQPGQAHLYLDEIVTLQPGHISHDRATQLYMTVILNQLYIAGDPTHFFDGHDLFWLAIQEGALAQEKQYPMGVTHVNKLAWLAVAAKDKNAARALFTRIGPNYDPRVWTDRNQFDTYKAWANQP